MLWDAKVTSTLFRVGQYFGFITICVEANASRIQEARAAEGRGNQKTTALSVLIPSQNSSNTFVSEWGSAQQLKWELQKSNTLRQTNPKVC